MQITYRQAHAYLQTYHHQKNCIIFRICVHTCPTWLVGFNNWYERFSMSYTYLTNLHIFIPIFLIVISCFMKNWIRIWYKVMWRCLVMCILIQLVSSFLQIKTFSLKMTDLAVITLYPPCWNTKNLYPYYLLDNQVSPIGSNFPCFTWEYGRHPKSLICKSEGFWPVHNSCKIL